MSTEMIVRVTVALPGATVRVEPFIQALRVNPIGSRGEPGPQGPQGDIGPQGPQGDTGPAGETGAVGPQGPAGAAGPAGEIGAAGPQGPQGPAGPTGPAGADGAIGPQGPTGAPGNAGPVGATGPAGPSNTIVDATLATLTSGVIPDQTLIGRNGSNFVGRVPHDATLKNTPVGADEIWISDSAASNALKRTTITALSSVGGLIDALTPVTRANPGHQILVEDFDDNFAKKRMPVWMLTNPYLRPPFVASGDDIEARDYLQNLGLSVYNTTDSVVPTWSGEVDPLGTLLTNGAQFRSSNGLNIAWFQGADLKVYRLHKALAAAMTSGVNVFWASVVPPPVNLTTLRTAGTMPVKPVISLFLSKTSGGLPDGSNGVIVGWRDNGRIEAFASTVVAGFVTDYKSVTADAIFPVADILGLVIDGTNNVVKPFLVNSTTGQTYWWTDTIAPGGAFLLSLDRWGLIVNSGAGTAFGTNNMTGFRFLRRRPVTTVAGASNNWICGF